MPGETPATVHIMRRSKPARLAVMRPPRLALRGSFLNRGQGFALHLLEGGNVAFEAEVLVLTCTITAINKSSDYLTAEDIVVGDFVIHSRNQRVASSYVSNAVEVGHWRGGVFRQLGDNCLCFVMASAGIPSHFELILIPDVLSLQVTELHHF